MRQMCIESSFQGQNLWDVVNDSDVTPQKDDQDFKKWKIKAGRLIVIKTIIE